MNPELAKRINSLSPEKRALLQKLLDAEQVKSARAFSIPRRQRSNDIPLSFGQQRLWFLQQLDPNSHLYNLASEIRLNGPLNVPALERAISEIIRRHECLRTTFSTLDGEPFQRISSPAPFFLPIVDLQHLPLASRADEAARLVAAAGTRPFQIEKESIRLALFRLSEQEHVLLLAMHHIVSDGWSMGVLIKEMATLYEAYSEGRDSPLEELPVQYADYAVWQRGWLRGEVLDEQLSYWKEQLAGAPAVLELPADRPRPAVQTFRGATRLIQIPAEVLGGLQELSRREGVTLFMTVLAAFKVLLHRYSGVEDLVVGTPIANRTQPEVEGLIGFFVNTLVLRTEVSPDAEFRDVLARVREVTLRAYAHQDVPFEKLVEELQPERDTSHHPLFQSVFVLQNTPQVSISVSELQLDAAEIPSGASRFDLTLTIKEYDGRLHGSIEYNTDLFDSETAGRMAAHYCQLLRSIIKDPRRPVSELELLDESEYRQLLADLSDTRREYPQQLCLHELCRRQALRTPDATAVSYDATRLSYRELEERTNQLARHLQRHGVGPEVRVGLMLQRTPELVVAMLGVLKAGGAYVPLDPDYPLERLSFIIEDAQLTLLITSEELRDRLPASCPQLVCLDFDAGELARYSTSAPSAGVDVDNLAYVIYTSGSTGRPKGVMVTHRNATRLFDATAAWFEFGPSDTWTLFHSSAFDFSVWEIWGALLYGGRLVVVPRNITRSPAEFYELLRQERVTILNQTPSAFRQLSQHEERFGVASDLALRLVIFGGEALDLRALQPWFERHGDTAPRLVNMYGITETTVHVTYRPLVTADAEARGSLIGIAIPDLKLCVLDHAMQPAPVGVAGELYVGGAGLARGYLGRPDLTAERFVPDPFSAQPGARLYRTGDLGHLRSGGDVEYRGRADHQVKIRGFRIETGEIEAVLRAHASVREAVVLLREDSPGESRLVAYVVVDAQTDAALRGEFYDFCRGKLPDYMVPSAFVVLDHLPLTANGKLDRKALPAPHLDRELAATLYVAPRNGIEEALCGIWADLLQLETVGIRDNFFELGGHSLLVTQVLSRIRDTLQVEISVGRLFEFPTIAGLSPHVATAMQDGHALTTPAIRRAGRATPPPLSFAQQRLWFLNQLDEQAPLYIVPLPVRLKGHLDAGVLERALSEVVRRHEALRTTFTEVDGGPVQVISSFAPLHLPLHDLSHLPEKELEALRLANEEAQKPFDLERGPLMRVQLVKLAEDEHICFLTLHHIITDGWSMGVLIREVATLYQAFAEGDDSPLPELPIQYADYAIWQRDYLQGEVLEQQLRYWKQQLTDVPAVLELPTDRPRPAVQTFRGGTYHFELGGEVSRGAKELSRREGVTLFMTLVAAFKVLLSRHSGEQEIVVGTPIANRSRAEVEGLIGLFINTLVLRSHLTGELEFRQVLNTVRDVTLGAYAHPEVPFEKLVEELDPERNLSHSPLFQVWFVLQNAHSEEFNPPGLSLSPLKITTATSMFDLTLSMQEQGDKLAAVFEYNTDLFDSTTIERIAAHFHNLLESFIRAPQQRIAEAEMLSGSERRQLLLEWNNTAREYPHELCVHELFERQTAIAPGALALSFRQEELTYAELNDRANRLAHYLLERGVGPERFVGILMERSVEMMVSVLAVLKAGGAYLPLDPKYPHERLSMMIADAEPVVLLTTEEVSQSFAVPGMAEVICVDIDREQIASRSAANLRSPVLPDNLAYMIYTSGSTGRPKGVLISHRAVVNHNHAVAACYEQNPHDRVLQFASLSFDVAVEEMFPTWLTGGSVVLREEQLMDSHAAFFDFLARERVTVVNLTTPLWNELMREWENKGQKPELSLRVAAIGGERGLIEQFKQWKKLLGEEVRLLNVYGPTETTVTNTAYEVLSNQPVSGVDSVVIGSPLANTEVYVLDEGMRPVPVGVSGEIYIGGESLARGYYRDARQTAEKFVPDELSGKEGARLYRSGDVGRRMPDGTVEFVGRVDRQVKLRGYRVEVGEVEAALARCEEVSEAVVEVREGQGKEKTLVGYVVLKENGEEGELRRKLKERLPEYMVPQVIVVLQEMPLTRNGKVDRRALPAPEETWVEESEYAAPRTQVESLLATIWSEVLDVTRIGVHDDFFELGGHSLLATRVMSRVREAFKVEIPLRQLFEEPTISQLAQAIEAAMRAGQELDAPALEVAPRDDALPLSFAQQRLWFLDQLEPNTSAFNMPATVRLKGRLDAGALERALTEVVRRHEALRTSFAATDGRPTQVIREPAPFHLSPQDLSHTAEAEREAEALRLANEEAQRPFDLARGPLLRARLLRLQEQEHLCLLTMHHIVSDGWSMGVLIKEMATLYEAYSEGRDSPLEELPVQYADYAVWQRGWLRGAVLEEQLSYWKKQLAGAPGVLELPADRPRPAVQTFRGATRLIEIPAEVLGSLQELSRREGVTLFMTVLAAFKVLLHRYSGQEDITVGAPVANRQAAEVERLIGFFVNTLVLRTDLSGDPSFDQLLLRVRETSLGAYAHQDVPFEMLVEELQPDRDMNHSPLFDVLVNSVNDDGESLHLPELTIEGIELASPQTRFLMTLYIEEFGGRLALRLRYQQERFSEELIAALLKQMVHLLEQIVSNPREKIGRYSLIPADAKPSTAVMLAAPTYPPITDQILSWAEKTPRHTALVQGENSWTYGQFADSANAIAQTLLALGVKPGDVVAVCGPRSFGLIASMTGVFLCRGVLLTIDRHLPVLRQRIMLEQACAKYLLYVGERQVQDDWMRDHSSLTVVEINARSGLTSRNQALGPQPELPELLPEDAAYIFFTSGTTDVPKGVLGWHNGLSHFLYWQRETFDINPQERAAQLTGLSFDVVLRDIFLPLISGATLCLPSEDDESAPERIVSWLERQKISIMHTVPALAQMWLTSLENSLALHSLRCVFFAGEPLTDTLVKRWREISPGCEIVNLYGPTETTLAKCFYRVPGDPPAGVQPVGKPLPHTEALVINDHGGLCGIGERGEIVLRTPFRSLGYINAPEEDRSRFVQNPFNDDPHDVVYHTGDTGRYRADGLLEILGRRDQQVKIRGVRVEPGEVMAALARHPAVAECFVFARRDAQDRYFLAAYVVPKRELETSASQLIAYLGHLVPPAMIPAAYVFMDELPLTPNGKIDRSALPHVDPQEYRPSVFVAPRNETESELAEILMSVLGRTEVGVMDNFFEIGGHSLLGTQVIARVNRKFRIELPLRSIFEQPTIAGLAQIVEQQKRAVDVVRTSEIIRVAREAYRAEMSPEGTVSIPEAFKD